MIFNIFLILFIIILYIILTLITKNPLNNKNSLFLKISFLILFILMSTRTISTGTDTKMYVAFFEKTSLYGYNLKILGNYYEPLFVLFNIILGYISKNPRFFIIFTSFIICFSFYSFIKKNSKNYLLSVLIFIGLLFFYSSMNIIRQYLAISLLLLSFDFVKNKKLIQYIFFIIIASFIHSSALVGIFIYPLYNIKYTKTRVLLIIILAILSNVFISDLINYIYSFLNRTNYYDYRVGKENISNFIHMLLFFFIYLFSLIIIKKNKNLNKNHNSFYLYIFLMVSAFSLIAMNLNVLSRATAYFNIFSTICIPNVIEDNINNKSNNFYIKLLLIIFLFVYSSLIICLRPEWNTAFNYQNYIIQNN